MFDHLPFPLVYAVFFVGSMIRANATYWLGRGARAGGENTRAGRRLSSPVVRRAETVIARFGAPAVALSFLTVGVQTALNFAAGVLRMPLWRYEVGAVIGALMWAGIYSSIGFAVFGAWVGESPWSWVLAAVALVGLVVLATKLTSRRLGQTPPYAAPAAAVVAPAAAVADSVAVTDPVADTDSGGDYCRPASVSGSDPSLAEPVDG